jgi:putative SOS response-associated peptidase YedK
MCGRVAVDYDEIIPGASDEALSKWISGVPRLAQSSFNVKPTQGIPAAYTDIESGEKLYELAFWSLIPKWSQELKPKYPTFNARSETVSEKRTFAPALKHSRCAITVSSFYEWSGPGSQRTPHAIFGPEPLLPMAGLFSWWHAPGAAADSGWYLTATILTQKSDGVMSSIHDRMPVFLADELVDDWLDPNVQGADLLDHVTGAAVPISKQLTEHKVAPLRGDGPELLLPTNTPDGQETLF